MDQICAETGWRGSREGWLEAARAALLDSGVDAVRIQSLAKRVRLSRTSFYWFFKDREALLASLVAAWRDQNTGAIVRQSSAYAESLAEAMLARRQPGMIRMQPGYDHSYWFVQSFMGDHVLWHAERLA